MEERNIKALEELTKQSDEKYIELLKNNQLTKILRAIGLFPDQTITNDVLIITQKPEATCVKRMRDWNYYKRSVNKNEKAIKVISHYIEKYDQDFTDEQGNIYTKGVEKLKTDLGYLFDISQTNDFPRELFSPSGRVHLRLTLIGEGNKPDVDALYEKCEEFVKDYF